MALNLKTKDLIRRKTGRAKLNNFTALKKGGIFISKIRKEDTDLNNIEKAIEIRNARIRFVSLVDKAANLQSFLVTKNKDGEASFK